MENLTTKELFKKYLPELIAEKAIYNTNAQDKDRDRERQWDVDRIPPEILIPRFSNLQWCLWGAFKWRETLEGWYYWKSVYDEYREKDIHTILKLIKITYK